jgi:hypothetical protein
MSAIPGRSAVAPGSDLCGVGVCHAFPHAEVALLISRLRAWSVRRAGNCRSSHAKLNIAAGPVATPTCRLPSHAGHGGLLSRGRNPDGLEVKPSGLEDFLEGPVGGNVGKPLFLLVTAA